MYVKNKKEKKGRKKGEKKEEKKEKKIILDPYHFESEFQVLYQNWPSMPSFQPNTPGMYPHPPSTTPTPH